MAATDGGARGGRHLALTESEVEFVAEDELVYIVPNFRMDALSLISGTVGPFRPQIPLQVPLWLALALKKRHKCTIQTPQWMTLDNLTAVLEAERDSEVFQPLPFHYIEIAQLLFSADTTGTDIPNAYKVRTLVQDIKDVRFHKMETGLGLLNGATRAVKLMHVTAMEVTLVRPFFCGALEALHKLNAAAVAAADEAAGGDGGGGGGSSQNTTQSTQGQMGRGRR